MKIFLVAFTLFQLTVFGQNSFVKYVDSFAKLKAINPNDINKSVFVAGKSSSSDGYEGIFVWIPGSTSTADDASVVASSFNGANGRWIRVLNGSTGTGGSSNSTVLNAVLLGADKTGTADSTAAIISGINAIKMNGGAIYFPYGTYKFSSQLDFTTPSGSENLIKIYGDRDHAATLYYLPGSTDTPAIKSGVAESDSPSRGAIVIENLRFYNASVLSGNGIEIMNGSRQTKISNVSIDNFKFGTGTGLTVHSQHTTDIEKLRVTQCKSGVLIGGKPRSTQYAHVTMMRDILIESMTATNFSLKVDGSDSFSLHGGNIEGNAGGIVLTNCINAILDSIYQEVNIAANNNSYLTLSRVNGAIIHNCTFYGLSRASYPLTTAINIGLGSGVNISGCYFSEFVNAIEFGHWDDDDKVLYATYSPFVSGCSFSTCNNRYLFTQNLTGNSTLTEIAAADGTGGDSFKLFTSNGGQSLSFGGSNPFLYTTLTQSGTNTVYNSWSKSGLAGFQGISIGSSPAYTRLYAGTTGDAYIQFGRNGSANYLAPSITNTVTIGLRNGINVTNLSLGSGLSTDMQVTADGYVGIGGAPSSSPNYLNVNGTINGTGSLVLQGQFGGLGNLVLVNSGTLTGSRAGYRLTQTWNNGVQLFDLDDYSVTDTASSSTSRVLKRTVNSVNVFAVNKFGSVTALGGVRPVYQTTTIDLTPGEQSQVVLVNGASKTITLTGAVNFPGKVFTIKLIASGTTCTVATSGGNTIDGAASYSLSAQYKYVTVMSDGSNWHIIANN